MPALPLAASAEKLAAQTEEELRSLRVELEKRGKDASSQYQEQQRMIEKLKEALKVAETSLSQEQKQRAEAEARYRLVLEDSSATSSAFRGSGTGAPGVGGQGTSSLDKSHALGLLQHQRGPSASPASDDTSRFMTPSPVGEEGGGAKGDSGCDDLQRLLSSKASSRVGGADLSTLPTSPALPGPPVSSAPSYLSSADWELLWHDQRWIDLLLLGPGGVGKTGLVEQLLVKIGDEVHLEQLRVTRKMEDQAPFSKLPQHYDLIYPLHNEHLDGIASSSDYRNNASSSNAVAGSNGGGSGLRREGGAGGDAILGRRLTLIDFPGLSRTKQDPTPRIKQAFIVGIVYDPTKPETCQEALRIAKNLVLPARGGGGGDSGGESLPDKKEDVHSQVLSAALRGRVYLIENTWRVASKEGTIRVDTAAVRDTGK